MMKWTCLLLVGLVVSGVSAELLQTLDNLVQSQWYHNMSEQNQVCVLRCVSLSVCLIACFCLLVCLIASVCLIARVCLSA